LVAQGQIKGDSGESQGVCARVVNGEGSGYLNGPGAPLPARSDAPSGPLALFRQNGARPERPLSLRFRTGPTRRRRVGPVAWFGQKHDAGARGLAERTQIPILAERTQPTVLAEQTQKAQRLPCAGNLRRCKATPRRCDSAVPLSHPLGTWDTGTAGRAVPSFQTLAPGTWNGCRATEACSLSRLSRTRDKGQEQY
jgi:hypothetical protein